jgi:YgiT-type zinc finger domain-containing protein
MGNGHEDSEKDSSKCRVGGTLLSKTTDLPFKVADRTIVILKSLPVAQCERCSEYMIEDSVFAKVEQLRSKVDTSVELEIIPSAA